MGVLSPAILFACTGLLVYWLARCPLICSATGGEINRVLPFTCSFMPGKANLKAQDS